MAGRWTTERSAHFSGSKFKLADFEMSFIITGPPSVNEDISARVTAPGKFIERAYGWSPANKAKLQPPILELTLLNADSLTTLGHVDSIWPDKNFLEFLLTLKIIVPASVGASIAGEVYNANYRITGARNVMNQTIIKAQHQILSFLNVRMTKDQRAEIDWNGHSTQVTL